MRILILGSNGQLGRCLADQLAFTEHDVIYASRAEIDIGLGFKAQVHQSLSRNCSPAVFFKIVVTVFSYSKLPSLLHS